MIRQLNKQKSIYNNLRFCLVQVAIYSLIRFITEVKYCSNQQLQLATFIYRLISESKYL